MKGQAMIRVFLLDDHALVRAGYRMILQNELDIEVIGEAASGEEGLPVIKKLKPDVVLCDLHLPGISGLEITERITRAELGIKVLIVSVQEEGPMPKRLLDAGASAYIGKAGDSKELLKAIREAMRGKRFLGAEIAQRMALAGDAASPFTGLSPREMEISMMFCHGMRAEDIARKLSLSAKTVATHKCRLLAKLGVADTISMARLAAQHGITEPARSL
jgi:two-component system, NarL family, invasion response regulator UvrY